MRSGSKPGLDHAVAVVGGEALDPLQGQHPARRAPPVDARHAKTGIVGAVLGELGRGRRFQAKIHLHARRGREGLDRRRRLQAPDARLQPFDPGRDPGEQIEIGGHLLLDPRPQDLDRDLLAV